MSDLSPEARRLLEDAAHADDPTPGDQERVARALAVPLGLAALAPTAAQAASAAGTSFAATSLVKGAALVTALVGLSVGAAWRVQATHRRTPVATAARVAPAHAPAPVAAPVPVVATAPALAPAPTAPSVVTPERPAARPAREAPSVDSLRAESQLLGEAHRAMNDGDGARALRLLDAYRERFPRGVLREEHAVARVLALCQTGRRAEARAAAERFLRAHPRSPLAARVEGACADPAGPARE